MKRRPFCRTLSLWLDAVIVALEEGNPSPARRDWLRRRKAWLETAVPARRPR